METGKAPMEVQWTCDGRVNTRPRRTMYGKRDGFACENYLCPIPRLLTSSYLDLSEHTSVLYNNPPLGPP